MQISSLLNKDKLSSEQVREMILAYNLFDVISKQTDIYSNNKNTGQILIKISKINDQNNSNQGDTTFENIKKIIQNSLIFNDIVKKRFASKDAFLKEKEVVTKEIEKYQFFSMGKYLTLSIFELILKKCEYKPVLIDEKRGFFSDKEFIKENIVRRWLPEIVDHLMKPAYDNFNEKGGSSLQKTFYNRTTTKVNIEEAFKHLHFALKKEAEEIFPFEIGTK